MLPSPNKSVSEDDFFIKNKTEEQQHIGLAFTQRERVNHSHTGACCMYQSAKEPDRLDSNTATKFPNIQILISQEYLKPTPKL